MAPDRQDATHRPQPLHKIGLISALPENGPSSVKEGAEYGHMEIQTPQELQMGGSVLATIPLVYTFPWAKIVTARDAAALPWAMDSSIGFG